MLHQYFKPPKQLEGLVRYFWVLDFDQISTENKEFRVFARRYPRIVFQHHEGRSSILHGRDALPLAYILLFVEEGTQMSYFEMPDKLHVIAFTYPPNLCAIPESFLYQAPSSYYLKCLSDSQFLSITYNDLHEVFDQSQEIERLFRKMTEAVLVGLISRHIELHSLTIEERFKNFCSRSGFLLHQVPHKWIASYLGINETNFSKLYNKVKS